MTIHYKILELNPNENSVVIRYYTDILTEDMLANHFDGNGNAILSEDGYPTRCKTDYNINLFDKIKPTESEIAEIAKNNAPIAWLEMMEKVENNEVDFSEIQPLKGSTHSFEKTQPDTNTKVDIIDIFNNIETPLSDVELIINTLNLTSSDTFMDLGSGDGRFVIAAAKAGANAIGIEKDATKVENSIINAQKENVNVTIKNEDFFNTDLSVANVFFMNLNPLYVQKLSIQLENLPAGTRLISYAALIPWKKPDSVIINSENVPIYFWTL